MRAGFKARSCKRCTAAAAAAAAASPFAICGRHSTWFAFIIPGSFFLNLIYFEMNRPNDRGPAHEVKKEGEVQTRSVKSVAVSLIYQNHQTNRLDVEIRKNLRVPKPQNGERPRT
jgi:hypothetical protein